MATKTQTHEQETSSKDQTPYGVEFHGYITVARAAAIANEKVSTVNYWLREKLVDGFRLETSERDGSKLDRSAVLLVSRKSLQAWLDDKPRRQAEKAEAKRTREQEAEELKALRAQEEELKRKRQELKAKYAGSRA